MTSPRRGNDSRVSEAIWITLACALAAGACELAAVGTRRFVNGHFVFTGWQTAWTTPASYALLMLPGGIALGLFARWWPRRFGPGVLTFLPAFVAAASVAWLWVPQVHMVAALVLSAGVAVQTARTATGRFTRFVRGARVVALAGAVLVALAAIAVHGGRMAKERHTLSSLPAAESDAPSVLLVVLDAVRAKSLSLYGYQRKTTPRLTAFAAGGIAFDSAYATAPWTLTSHASMLTGLYPDEMQAGWRTPLEREPATLAEVLARRGYASGGFVANVAYTSRETGLARGFTHYEDYLVSVGEMIEASSLGRSLFNSRHLRKRVRYFDVPGRKTSEAVTHDFLKWQAGLGGRPFFAFLNLYDTHEPYLPPPPFDTVGGGGWRDLTWIEVQQNSHGRMADRHWKFTMETPERLAHQAAYDGTIAYTDEWLGRMFAELERRGQLARTLVIVTADHGEQFGEHGIYSHANSLFLPALHIPLVMVMPGRVAAGVHGQTPVSLRDLAETVLALVSPADTAAVPGRPLVAADGAPATGTSPLMAHILPPPNQDPRYSTARGEMHSLIVGRWHYIRGPGTEEALFDMTADPDEWESLAGRPEGRVTRDRLRAALDSVARRGR